MSGSRSCQCSLEGTDPSDKECNERGECSCKRNVIGSKCTLCKSGFYGLESSNPHGCKQCFCYGHSSVCKVADGFTGRNISTQFTSGLDLWTVVNEQGMGFTTLINAKELVNIEMSHCFCYSCDV